MKQKSNIFVNLCCNYWIFKFTQKIRIFDNINKPDISNTFTSIELNLYHKQFTGYPHARTMPLRQSTGADRVSVGKLEGTRPVRRPRYRWDGNTKMDLQKVEWGGMGRTDLAQDRDKWWALVNVAMNLEVPKNEEIFMTR
jgi:hypothetical protein